MAPPQHKERKATISPNKMEKKKDEFAYTFDKLHLCTGIEYVITNAMSKVSIDPACALFFIRNVKM